MPRSVTALRKEKTRSAIALEGDLVATIDDGVHVVAKFLLAGQVDRSGLRSAIERDNPAEGNGRLKGLLGAGRWRPSAYDSSWVTYVYRLQRQNARGRLLGQNGRRN